MMGTETRKFFIEINANANVTTIEENVVSYSFIFISYNYLLCFITILQCVFLEIVVSLFFDFQSP